MTANNRFLAISAALFAVATLAHVTRVVAQWPLAIGSWSIPFSLSVFAAIIAACLCAWALALLRSQSAR
jgi:biotin transporter BioY